MGPLYQRLCLGWCFSNNLHWDISGRIIIGWNALSLQVNIKVCSNQLIHLEVIPTVGVPFHCTFLYAATDKNLRMHLFSMLNLIAKNVSGPWIVAGDFNCIANLIERLGQVVCLSKVLPLRKCMNTCDLHDMKITGRFLPRTSSNQE